MVDFFLLEKRYKTSEYSFMNFRLFSKQISTFLKRHFWYGNSFLPQSIFQTFFPMKDRSNNILTIESSFCRKWMQKMLNLFLQRLDSFNQVVYVKWLKCQTWTHLLVGGTIFYSKFKATNSRFSILITKRYWNDDH